jgi:hypothetical protein
LRRKRAAAVTERATIRDLGLLDPRSPHLLATPSHGFRQGLKDTGYVDGGNVALEYRWAENRSSISIFFATLRPARESALGVIGDRLKRALAREQSL